MQSRQKSSNGWKSSQDMVKLILWYKIENRASFHRFEVDQTAGSKFMVVLLKSGAWCVWRARGSYQGCRIVSNTIWVSNDTNLKFENRRVQVWKITIWLKVFCIFTRVCGRVLTCLAYFPDNVLGYTFFYVLFEIGREKKNSLGSLLRTHADLSTQFIHSMIMFASIMYE